MAAFAPPPQVLQNAPPMPVPGGREPPAPGMPLCPRPLLNEWDYVKGAGYNSGRICGNWTAASPEQRCCLPCPAQDWLYQDAEESFSTAPPIALASLVFCIILLLSYLFLPADRTHRNHLSVGLISSLSIMSLAFAIAAPNSSSTCADPLTPHSIYSSSRCGATGILFHFGALSAGLWPLLGAINLHMKLVWHKSLEKSKSFFLLSIAAATMIPVIVIGITIATSGYAYGLGEICAVEAERSGGLMWGPVVVLSVLGLCVMTAALADVVLKKWRGDAHVPKRKSITLDGGSGITRNVGALDDLKRDLRGTLLGILLPLEFLVAASIMWASDQRLLHAKENAKIRGVVDCLVRNSGQVHLCEEAARGILPPKRAVIFAMTTTALLGLQTSLFLLTRSSPLRTWLQVLCHPLLTLRDKQYPPLRTRPHQRRGTGVESLASTTSTLPVSKDMAIYKVEQPPGSLRQMGRRPSLAARMRKESETRVMQLKDFHENQGSALPSPVTEEADPYGRARPPGPNPYGYDTRERNRSVVVVDGSPYAHENTIQESGWTDANPFAGSSFSMTSPPPAVFTSSARMEEVTPWDVAQDERPVSPVSPIYSHHGRRSWFRESFFEGGNGTPSRPVSPTTSPAPIGDQMILPPVPAAQTPKTPLRRAATTRAAMLTIPESLRPGFKRTQTDDSPVSPRSRNASLAVHWGRTRGGEDDVEGNPLRMNAVEPFRSRRFSQA